MMFSLSYINPLNYLSVLKRLQSQKISLILLAFLERLFLYTEDERCHAEAKKWLRETAHCRLIFLDEDMLPPLPDKIKIAYVLTATKMYYYESEKYVELPISPLLFSDLKKQLTKRYQKFLTSYPFGLNHEKKFQEASWLFHNDSLDISKKTARGAAAIIDKPLETMNAAARNEALKDANAHYGIFFFKKELLLWLKKENRIQKILLPSEEGIKKLKKNIRKKEPLSYELSQSEMEYLRTIFNEPLLGHEAKRTSPFENFERDPLSIQQIKEVMNATHDFMLAFREIETTDLSTNLGFPYRLKKLYKKMQKYGYRASTLLSRLNQETLLFLWPEWEKTNNAWKMVTTFLNDHQKSTENIFSSIKHIPISSEIGKTTGVILNRMQLNEERIDYRFLTSLGAILPQKIEAISELIQKYTHELSTIEPTLDKRKMNELNACAKALLNSIQYIQNNDAILSLISLQHVKLIRKIIKLFSTIIEQLGYLTENSQEALRKNIALLKNVYLTELFCAADKIEVELLLAPGVISGPLKALLKPLYQKMIQWIEKNVRFEGDKAALKLLDEQIFTSARVKSISARNDEALKNALKAFHAEEFCHQFFQEIETHQATLFEEDNEPLKKRLTESFNYFAPWVRNYHLPLYNALVKYLTNYELLYVEEGEPLPKTLEENMAYFSIDTSLIHHLRYHLLKDGKMMTGVIDMYHAFDTPDNGFPPPITQENLNLIKPRLFQILKWKGCFSILTKKEKQLLSNLPLAKEAILSRIQCSISTEDFRIQCNETLIQKLLHKNPVNLHTPLKDNPIFHETDMFDIEDLPYIEEARGKKLTELNDLSFDRLFDCLSHYQFREKTLKNAARALSAFITCIESQPSIPLSLLKEDVKKELFGLFSQFEFIFIAIMTPESHESEWLANAARILKGNISLRNHNVKEKNQMLVYDFLRYTDRLNRYILDELNDTTERINFFYLTLSKKESRRHESFTQRHEIKLNRASYVLKHTRFSEKIQTFRKQLLKTSKTIFLYEQGIPEGIRDYGLITLLTHPKNHTKSKLSRLLLGRPTYALSDNTVFFIASDMSFQELPIKRRKIPTAFERLAGNTPTQASSDDLRELIELTHHTPPSYRGLGLLRLSEANLGLEKMPLLRFISVLENPLTFSSQSLKQLAKPILLTYKNAIYFLDAHAVLHSIQLTEILPDVLTHLPKNKVVRGDPETIYELQRISDFHFLDHPLQKDNKDKKDLCYFSYDENYLYYSIILPSGKIVDAKISRNENTPALPAETPEEKAALLSYILRNAREQKHHPCDPNGLPITEIKKYFEYKNNGLILHEQTFYYVNQEREVFHSVSIPSIASKNKLLKLFSELPVNRLQVATLKELDIINPMIKRMHYADCYLLSKNALWFIDNQGLEYRVSVANFEKFNDAFLKTIQGSGARTRYQFHDDLIQELLGNNKGYLPEFHLGNIFSPIVLKELQTDNVDLPFPEVTLPIEQFKQCEKIRYLKHFLNGLYQLETFFSELEALNTDSSKEVYIYHVFQIKRGIDACLDVTYQLKSDPLLLEMIDLIKQSILKKWQVIIEETTPYHQNSTSAIETFLRGILLAPDKLAEYCHSKILSPHIREAAEKKAFSMHANMMKIIQSSHSWFRLFLQLTPTYKIFCEIREKMTLLLEHSYEEMLKNLETISEEYFTTLLLQADDWEIRLCTQPGLFSDPLKRFLDEYYKGLIGTFTLTSNRHLSVILNLVPFEKRLRHSTSNIEKIDHELRIQKERQSQLEKFISSFKAISPRSSFSFKNNWTLLFGSPYESLLLTEKKKAFIKAYDALYPLFLNHAHGEKVLSPQHIERHLFIDYSFRLFPIKPTLPVLNNCSPGKFTYLIYQNDLYFFQKDDAILERFPLSAEIIASIKNGIKPGPLNKEEIHELCRLGDLPPPHGQDLEILLPTLNTLISVTKASLTGQYHTYLFEKELLQHKQEELAYKMQHEIKLYERYQEDYLDILFESKLEALLLRQNDFLYIGLEYRHRLKTYLERNCESILEALDPREQNAEMIIQEALNEKKERFDSLHKEVFSILNEAMTALVTYQVYLNEAIQNIEKHPYETLITIKAKRRRIEKMLKITEDMQKTPEQRLQILQEKIGSFSYDLNDTRDIPLISPRFFIDKMKSIFSRLHLINGPKHKALNQKLEKTLASKAPPSSFLSRPFLQRRNSLPTSTNIIINELPEDAINNVNNTNNT